MQPLRVVSLSKLRDSSDWAKVALSSGLWRAAPRLWWAAPRLWRAAPRLCGGPLRGCGGPLRGHGGPLRGHGYPVALNSQLLQPGEGAHTTCYRFRSFTPAAPCWRHALRFNAPLRGPARWVKDRSKPCLAAMRYKTLTS